MTGRSIFLVFRWAGLAAVAPILWACNARSFETPVLKPEATFTKTFQQTINRNVDMLFLVDDSSSMKLSQDNLRRNFPTFMTRLKEDPGLPNIHVAVVSSDMGAGDGSAGGCDASKQGVFQYTAKAPPVGSTDSPCTTNLDPGATYIADVGGVRNYGGELEDAFSCIARLGQAGCGFEHQFAAILRALGADGAPAPAENQGFLRPDAVPRPHPHHQRRRLLREPGCAALQSQLQLESGIAAGPPKNFRCNEFGHICAGMHPNRNAPGNDMTQTVSYADCTSNDTEGYLLSAVDTANRIKGLKDKASQVIVAAITGPSTPYVVHWIPPTSPDTTCGAASCPWPEISHSCGSVDAPGGFADPAVRINQFVDQFGPNGLKLPICTEYFGPLVGPDRDADQRDLAAPLHCRHRRQEARNTRRRLYRRQPHLERTGRSRRRRRAVVRVRRARALLAVGRGRRLRRLHRRRFAQSRRADIVHPERDRQLRALHPGHFRARARVSVSSASRTVAAVFAPSEVG